MTNAKTFLEKRCSDEMALEDAVHTALLTLKEGFEGQVSGSNIEVRARVSWWTVASEGRGWRQRRVGCRRRNSLALTQRSPLHPTALRLR
jgi:hypothetical protein